MVLSKFVQTCVVGALFVGLGACASSLAGEPRLDGQFDEWQLADRIATDPASDASGAFDVRNLYAMSRGSRLFLRFDIGSVRNLPSGSGSDGTLRVEIAMPGNRFLTIDLRNRTLWRDNNSGLTMSWSTLGFSALPTFAASEFEIAVDLAFFGVAPGSNITINFSGSDVLASSAPFTMTGAATAVVRRSADRAPGTTIRVASLNTLQTGILNGTQAPKLSRLVDSANADIYCFQEEYNSSVAQIDTFVTNADPLENGANWTVHKNFDNAIATHGTLIPMASGSNSYAAAVVDLGGGNAAAVIAIHPKCCGYIGSSEDSTRITQMNLVAGTIASLRSGTLGGALVPYANAPIILIGDWNIVGSRTPLDIAENPDGPDLIETLPVNLIGDEVLTWRGNSTGAGSFWPGRLDLVAHSRTGITPLKSFLVDTALLNSGELSSLGLQSGDSGGSDHLLMVADFTLAAPPPPHCDGNANGDAAVDFDDITSILANWSGVGPAGDANNSGGVDFDDITSVLSHWGETCP